MFETIKKVVEAQIKLGGHDDVTVVILTKELGKLREVEENLPYLEEQAEILSCLEAAGVDNWEGYSYAQEMMWEAE